MKWKFVRARYRRLIGVSIICGILLTAIMMMRQQAASYEDLDLLLAGSSSSYSQVTNQQTASIEASSSYRRASYSEAMGRQHEERRKGKGDELYKDWSETEQEREFDANNEEMLTKDSNEELSISVRLSDNDELEEVTLEQYVLGVALAELPGSFEKEAIKAQMLAARTYIVRRLLQHGHLQSRYEVSDTTVDQVYMSLQQIEQYKQDYPEYYRKFVDALKETKGLIIHYEDEPIDAVFFSTSNGYTEDAEQLWGKEVPYLQSVASPWEKNLSPAFEKSYDYTFSELYEKLNLKQGRRNGKLRISNVSKNDSGRIQELEVNGASFSGRELREKLGLASTSFEWKIDEQQQLVTILCYGYGHGIGLSQWGANGMAMEGYLAEEIIKHYYRGVEIGKLQSL